MLRSYALPTRWCQNDEWSRIVCGSKETLEVFVEFCRGMQSRSPIWFPSDNRIVKLISQTHIVNHSSDNHFVNCTSFNGNHIGPWLRSREQNSTSISKTSVDPRTTLNPSSPSPQLGGRTCERGLGKHPFQNRARRRATLNIPLQNALRVPYKCQK